MSDETFGTYLAHAREQRGLSIRQLAKQLGVQPSTISRLEGGTRDMPSLDLLTDLIDTLDLDALTAMKLLGPYRRLYEQIATQLDRSDDRE